MQRGFAHIFALVGILVIILVVGEVLYLTKIKSAKDIQEVSNGPIISDVASEDSSGKVPPTQIPKANGFLQIPSITIDTAAKQPEFNSYLNPGLGFEFNYEKNLTVKEDSEEAFNKRGNGDFRKNFSGYIGYEPGKVLGAVAVLDTDNSFDKNPFSVWVFDNPEDLTAEKWFDKYWYYPFVWGVFDLTSKGHIALDQEATLSGQIAKYKIVPYQPGSPKFVYVAKSGKMYLLRTIGEVGDKILSAFKFLDIKSK